ncbi:MAG: hypothetical protein GY702_23155 [Desulfobulbaceae bacterium]|nr:hypothetical protein [Desulfobulbaceae bacterium]
MMLTSYGKEFSENLGQAYKAMTYHLEKLWTNLVNSFDHSFTTLIHPLPTLRRDKGAQKQNACGTTTGFLIKKTGND